MPDAAQELKEARRLRRFVSLCCAEIHADCVRMRSVCADQAREVEAMRERLRASRTPNATQQQMDST